MQLEAKANLLIVTELISKLEVEGHPAVGSSSAFGKEVKLPASNIKCVNACMDEWLDDCTKK